MPSLETKRLLLRNFVPADWEAINAILSDHEVTRHMHFSNWTAEQRREWFDWCLSNNQESSPDVYNWAITLREHDSLIGWFGIGSSTHAAVEAERDFGYLLGHQFWGQGYMTEALQAIIAFEFETLGTPRLSATCDVNNPASARVMQKAGMRHERTAHDTDSEGNWAHRHHYALDKLTTNHGVDAERSESMTNSSSSLTTPEEYLGTWQLTSSVSDGQSTLEAMVQHVQVVISEGSHTVYVNNQVVADVIPFVIDTSVTPYCTTDFLPDGQQIHGISRVDGDVLTSCVAAPGQEAPKEFVSTLGSGRTLRVFKRVTT